MKKVWSSTKLGKKRFLDNLEDFEIEINANTFVSIRSARKYHRSITKPWLHAVVYIHLVKGVSG